MAQITLNSSGVASNGSLLLQSNGTTTAVTIDTAQNMGLGVTPSAWGQSGTLQAIQIKNTSLAGSGSNAYWGANWFGGGFDKYIQNGAASLAIQTGGQHIWYNAASGTAGNTISFTQAMTLDASGNLLLNTTGSPAASAKMKIATTARTGAFFDLTATGGENWIIDSTNTVSSTDVLGIYANGATGMYLTDTGNLLVGTTSTVASAAFVVSKSVNDYLARFINSNATAFGLVVNYSGASPNSTGQEFLRCVDSGGTDRMTVRSNGGIANYSANDVNLSDRREKTNFAPAKSYLETICAIPVQTFNYIDQNMEEDGGLTLGIVAQDVQAVAPELVMESNWGTEENPKMRLSIYQTDLQYALMKCIQEQQAIITQLQADVEALKNPT